MNEQLAGSLERLSLEERLIQEIYEVGHLKKLYEDDILASSSSDHMEIPLVLSGSLKVMRRDANGNEVLLYYLEPPEFCAMSVSCCVRGRKMPLQVVAEEDAVLWMIPSQYIDQWIEKFQSFRKLIFDGYQNRFDEVMDTLDSIAFMNLDERLYKYLLDKKQASGSYIINKTHKQIASELNSSRVVISRLLKRLENEEKIEQYRNRIEIL